MNTRDLTLQIAEAALKAVDPFKAVQRNIKHRNNEFICGTKVYNLKQFNRVRVVGFGKGSAPMAQAVHACLGDRITDGLVIVKYQHTLPTDVDVSPIEIVEAGHPIPDENGVKQTKRLSQLLQDSTEDDLIICLISGGGSALLTQPVEAITLAHIQTLTQLLLAAGADISEINTIRKHLSAVKGGQLARLAAPATLVSLILSDVKGDQLDIIASGPTVPDQGTFQDALAVVKKYELTTRIPTAILNHLQAGAEEQIPETPKPGNPIFQKVQNLIVANNQMAVDAATNMAHRLDLNAAGFAVFLEGEAQVMAEQIGILARQLSGASSLFQKPACLIFGGETTVTLSQQHGLGGRNQELALACAFHLLNEPNLLVATVATDGNDGPTDAAGAFVDGQTIPRAEAMDLDPQQYLDQHDSYHFFETLDDLIITGPTNTNVNDLVIIMAW